jgi:hypothetical protein
MERSGSTGDGTYGFNSAELIESKHGRKNIGKGETVRYASSESEMREHQDE